MNDTPKQTNAFKPLSTAEMMRLVSTKGLGPAIAIIGEHLDKRATMPKNVPNSVDKINSIIIELLEREARKAPSVPVSELKSLLEHFAGVHMGRETPLYFALEHLINEAAPEPKEKQ